MTEKEKMLKGELYNANYDKELIKEREQVKDLCFQYNNTLPSNRKRQRELLSQILAKDNDNILIEAPFYCDYGYNIKVGKNFYANHGLVLLDAGTIEFGDNVFIGPGCHFYTSHHPFKKEIRNEGLEYASPIKVGNDVWFGGNTCIVPNVTIGDNVIIGAGSVIVDDIPSNSIAVGNPCKVIKKIDGDTIISIPKIEKL